MIYFRAGEAGLGGHLRNWRESVLKATEGV